MPPGNLPAVGSTFVGRRRELGEIKKHIEASRLVTLTGPGGVGKTRLAVQAAQQAHRAFPDGAWLVDLAAVEDPAQVAEAMVATLRIPDQSAAPAAEQLARHLAHRILLLVMDNCEHLLPTCAQLVDTLLRRSPGLRVLATSRQSLQLPGERLYVVTPLATPRPDSELAPEVLAGYDSVALLIDRATAVQPGFTMHEGNCAAIARLCARLDGLPLAIELAAKRLRSLSVEQVTERLDDRFRLLNRGSPAAQPRQRTLHAVIDWSYELCSEQERRLWARLSVFPADFDLAAAETICAGRDLPREAVLDHLDELVAKSVLSARPKAPAARYQMLETIRQYGRERLDQDGLTYQLQRQHRDYYLSLARQLYARWSGPDQTRLLETWRLEHRNLMTALDWSLAEAEQSSALELVSALSHHWLLNYPAAGRRRLEQVLAAAPEPSPARGDALCVAALITRIQGDTEASTRWRRECAEIADRVADERLHAWVQLLTGTMELFTRGAGDAIPLLEASIAMLRKQGDRAGLLQALFHYALALAETGDSPGAQAACAEAIALTEAGGERWERAMATYARAFDLWRNSDRPGEATETVYAALRFARRTSSQVVFVELLAWIAGSRGEHERAAQLLGAAAARWQSTGPAIDRAFPLLARYSNRCRAAALEQLGGAGFKESFEYGRTNPAEALNTPGTDPAAASAPDSTPTLTHREWEVATLIANGYTNKAIAAELVLSPHTVGGHVERLFSKLGINARAQVATWLAQTRAAQPHTSSATRTINSSLRH
jgi:predicted ATPase/DNA-binding CsgD family transcriptional regulator